ncbi:efflux RND transporter permease subunit [Cupriavidus sp. TMH.W2]|uniref:efflux RND transporter permease subunit n=1 Tax=Cupriavidus sp. TMH.W2 TaxID=3434465 RepID=UPI003D77EDE1
MLTKIVSASLSYRLLVIVLLLVLAVAGIRAWQDIPVDAFPDVTPIQVSVVTESPGVAPEDVERLVTFPIESSMAGLPGVRTVRSLSLFGLSTVTVFFEDSTDIYFARRLVAERLQEAKTRIPEGFGEPELGPNASGLGQVFWYTVEAQDRKLSNMDLRTLHDWSIRLQLRTAPGVDEVISWGGQEKQFQVLVDPHKLVKYGITLKAVLDTVLANNRQVGGQYLNVGQEQYLVRGIGRVERLADLGSIPLGEVEGTPFYVRDVAEIHEAGGLRFGAVTKDGREVVFGMALQRIGENAKNVVRSVKAKLAAIQQTLPPGVKILPVYDRTDLVDRAVSTATWSLIEGSVLVALVLLLFLGELRSALVVVLSLPLAMLLTFILMQRVGLSANLMSLAGLSVGIGMMIDGAVVVVENAYRLLSHGGKERHSKRGLILQATADVAKPVAFAILIILVVFLPLFTLTDIEGKLFKPMAMSISFAMASSLLLTLTAIPVLASFILRPKPEHDTWLVAHAKRIYLRLLDLTLDRKRKTMGIAVCVLGLSLALVPFLGREFMPTLQEGTLMFRITAIPSTSLEETITVTQRAEAVVRQFPEVETAVALIGRAERGEPEDVNRVEMLVNLKERKAWAKDVSYGDLAGNMREALEKALPTVVVSMGQPIQNRVDELVSGVRAPLALRLYGEDLKELDRLTTQIKAVIAKVPGAADLALEANQGKPQITVTVDRAEAARYGLSADDILEVVQTGVGGKAAGVVLDGGKRFDIRVWFQPQFRNSVEVLNNLPIQTKQGALLPLSRVAKVETSEGYAFIRHDELLRNAVIQMDVRGRDVNSFVSDAQAAIQREVKLPTGYRLQWGGAFENQQRAMGRLAVIVPLTIGIIFVLLYTTFNSAALAGIILANVPFAVMGGLISLFISGQYLSVPSAIGFIAVFGVAMLNGIVLVSFLVEQLAQGKPVREAVRNGALLRLRPVLMTASVTILGLLPMLVSQGVGAEVQRPLATVVVGGLLTSTALTLLLIPMLFEWLMLRRRGAITLTQKDSL